MRAIDPTSIEIEEFLTAWFGPRKDAAGTLEAAPLALPDGLSEWLSLTSQWGIPTSGVKTLSSPSELTEEEGKFIFMWDHGGWSWAFDPNTPLTVYEAKDAESWHPLRAQWREVFFHHVFTEAIESAPTTTWCADISESGLRRALEKFEEVSFTDSKWPGPGWRWYTAEGPIAYSGPKRSTHGRFTVTIGAKSSTFVDRLDLTSECEWRVRENH
ncbi:hypothetical protein [Streptomyces sp. NRRL S-515]|uniref:hypothetical protein n=1 Tax=Streptomyces sp. NRRL S-515 TaxID=1463913 RepID=UPI00131BD506|nr:hypothetical protein [Streptomyces sp. NRRL S-515]